MYTLELNTMCILENTLWTGAGWEQFSPCQLRGLQIRKGEAAGKPVVLDKTGDVSKDA